jgi:hypothetical protein
MNDKLKAVKFKESCENVKKTEKINSQKPCKKPWKRPRKKPRKKSRKKQFFRKIANFCGKNEPFC